MADRALVRLLRPLAGLVPRRLRRVAEKIERRPARLTGQIAAAGFLAATVVYALVVGGQFGRLSDTVLVALGFGIKTVQITGHSETTELAIVEKLDVAGRSLIGFDAAEARDRVAALPWVGRASVRKHYPDRLSLEIEERKPFALWQNDGEIFVIDRQGVKIVRLEDRRLAEMPLVVGDGANEKAAAFLAEALAEPEIAARMQAAVLVADRRWDVHLENGLTVKLPEKAAGAALSQLARLDEQHKLLSRDIVVIDLRLADRITVRLPQGRSLEEINGGPANPAAKLARAPT